MSPEMATMLVTCKTKVAPASSMISEISTSGSFEAIPSSPPPSGSINCFCCFVAGTKISLPNNEVSNIESIKVGDTVMSWSFKEQMLIEKVVTDVFSPSRQDLVQLEFDNETQTINTVDHPFYVIGKGWSSVSPIDTKAKYKSFLDIEVHKLNPKDKCLVLKQGKLVSIELNSITPKVGFRKTYNFRVKDTHCYFANGILVHNK